MVYELPKVGHVATPATGRGCRESQQALHRWSPDGMVSIDVAAGDVKKRVKERFNNSAKVVRTISTPAFQTRRRLLAVSTQNGALRPTEKPSTPSASMQNWAHGRAGRLGACHGVSPYF